MEELIKKADQLSAILDGHMSAEGADTEVQGWLSLSVMMFALEIVRAPVEHRKAQLEIIEREQPLFVDDVRRCAKAIIESGADTIPF